MNKTLIIGAAVAAIVAIGVTYMAVSAKSSSAPVLTGNENYQKAYFAGGCFWCVESSFEKHIGVIEVTSGYAGGAEANPTYKQVSAGTTGHREAVEVLYDPTKITYEDLLQILWRTANPTDNGGQYVDRGFQYTSAIWYSSDSEKALAEKSISNLAASGRFGAKPIVTPALPFSTFYPAEDYHQNYYKKNPVRYNFYTNGSGRKEFLEQAWGSNLEYKTKLDPEARKKELKARLTEIQYHVTQENGTEKPFDNAYNDNKADGIYVDIVDGAPLYSSLDKYDSGTGWPSFVKPISPDAVSEHEDRGLFGVRTEIRSTSADSHLGHVFDDGPADRGGKRYCMNSAALRFVPVADLEKEGYGEYLALFTK